MDELENEIHDQVTAASAALEQARAADDDYLVSIHEAELSSLAQTATDHGLVVDLRALEGRTADEQRRAAS